ncbi:MAG TPA: ketopantoate reductase family protein [bacterium]|nr:ketopantoate reductase family protein [bacterium]
MSARVLVLGCGAVGGIFAARLARVCEVAVLDTWTAHVEAIAARGLRVTVRAALGDAGRNDETIEARPAGAASDPAAFSTGRAFTHVLVAVKGPQTRAAVTGARRLLDGAVVLTVQNGLGNAETIASACAEPICHGVTMNAGKVTAPGEIAQAEVGPTWLGPHRAGLAQARGWSELLARAGLESHVLPDPRGAIWSKLIFNAAVNPLPVLTGLGLAAVYAHPETYALLRALVEEGKAVAAARGISLAADPMTVIDEHRALGSAHTHQGSMKQDIDRGRSTEIDTLTGALVAEADRAGVPVPALRTMYRLVKAVETAATARRAAPEARR